MKIGIVTLSLQENYGGILQNYALQQVLRNLGHEPITINYYHQISLYRWLGSTIRSILFYFSPKKKRTFARFKETYTIYRKKKIECFLKKHILLTECVANYKFSLISRYRLEAVITGSDQVWRPCYNLNIEDMYLSFVKQHGIKKIAYAASFGTDEWEYSDKQTTNCKKYAQRLDAISVRELSGIDLCKIYLGVDAIMTLDPTLLLDKDYYERLCDDIPKKMTQTIYAYILDVNEDKQRIINVISKKHGILKKVLAKDKSESMSVEQWIAMFRDAEYVVTDSFHGTVFSIIFQKPFLCIGNSKRGMARFKSLLSVFGLENRLIDINEFTDYDDKPIDWRLISEKMRREREKSLKFLTKALS